MIMRLSGMLQRRRRSHRIRSGVRLVLGAAVLLVAVVAVGSLRPARAHATPTNIWIVNQHVVDTIAGAPIDLRSAADRAAIASRLGIMQKASAAQVGPPGASAYTGDEWVLVQTNGLMTGMTLNGRGLTCATHAASGADDATVACDGVTINWPDAADNFAVWDVTDSGTLTIGLTFPVTAVQDSVAVDSGTDVAVVGQAHDLALSVAKSTIQGGLSSCSINDNTTSPQRTAALATYTDINGTPLVGYYTAWSSSSASNMIVALADTPSMLQVDGVTIAAANVACGVSAGSADVDAANATSGAIQGVPGQLSRTQTITMTRVAPVVANASSGGTTTTVETTLNGGAASTLYQVDLYSSPSCGAVSGNTHLGTFPATTDSAGDFTLYSMASAAVTPGWVVQATASDPDSNTSPMSGCQTVVARGCVDDTLCNGYTDSQKIALGKDPFTYCAIMRADVNSYGVVNIVDLSTIARYYNQTIPPAPARLDQNGDGKINIVDLSLPASQYNRKARDCASVTNTSLTDINGNAVFAGELHNESGVNILQYNMDVTFVGSGNNALGGSIVAPCLRTLPAGGTSYFSAQSSSGFSQVSAGRAWVNNDSWYRAGTPATGTGHITNLTVQRTNTALAVFGAFQNLDSTTLAAPNACAVVFSSSGDVVVVGLDQSLSDLAQNGSDTFSIFFPVVPNDSNIVYRVNVYVDGLKNGVPILPVSSLNNPVWLGP